VAVIEAIKVRLWEALRQKEVSLAMVYDRRGRILWHRGRSISGRTIDDAEGFPKSLIRATLADRREVAGEDVVVTSSGAELPQSARTLFLRSLLVLPVERDFYLYLDSGSREAFTAADHEVFRTLGGLLGETVAGIRATSADPGGVAGSSPAMERVRELLLSYAIEDEPVLLLGETGVGKNHLAELIHRASGRRGRLVVAHCPSVPESLFESEMFGHRRGAFTGAGEGGPGLVQEAEGGTLMLDEVSEIPTSVQAKLLSFVETRRYRPVGETREREADVRLLAASNRDLAAEVRAGRFRADLYYRLNVLPIEISPLRDRPEDLLELVEHHRDLLRGTRASEACFAVLVRHPWPGNVRELIQVLKRVGIRHPGPEIGAEVAEMLLASPEVAHGAESGPIAEVEAALRAGASFWDSAWRAFLDRDLNREQLRDLLRRSFADQGGSLRRLAEALHVDPADYPRFVSALHKYDVHPGR
jgi:DNA-binding NtrC family response regulator